MFLLSLWETTSSYTTRDSHHLHYLITAFTHLLLNFSWLCRYTVKKILSASLFRCMQANRSLKCNCIWSSQHINLVMGANKPSNVASSEKGGREATYFNTAYSCQQSSGVICSQNNFVVQCQVTIVIRDEYHLCSNKYLHIYIFSLYLSRIPLLPFHIYIMKLCSKS